MEKMIDEDFVLTDYDGTLLDKKQFLDSIKDTSIKLTQEMSEGMKLHSAREYRGDYGSDAGEGDAEREGVRAQRAVYGHMD